MKRDALKKPGFFVVSSPVFLTALVAVFLGACASPPDITASPQDLTRTTVVLQQPLPYKVQQAALGPTRLKRRVAVLDHAHSDFEDETGRIETASHRMEEQTLPLRVALERALLESGRYEVIRPSRRSNSTADPDAIRMSVELLDRDNLTTVKLYIHDPRSSATVMTFSGEGENIPLKTGVFIRGDAAKARADGLSYALRKALQSASAVLGSLPWQAPIVQTTDVNTVVIPGGKRLGLRAGVLLSIQTREQAIKGRGVRSEITIPSRLVGEVLIVGHDADPGGEAAAVGTVVSGSLQGYDANELVVRFCRPKGYFGHDFGHDRQCDAKSAALVAFDPETALLSISPESGHDGEALTLPYAEPALSPPGAVF